MAHSLGGFLDLPHGEVTLYYWIMWLNSILKQKSKNTGKWQSSWVELENMSDYKANTVLLNRIRDLKSQADINYTLKDAGVSPDDIGELSSKAMNDACIITNPRKPTQSDVEEIFRNAL
jgi:alcohol dehydrogenase class IV